MIRISIFGLRLSQKLQSGNFHHEVHEGTRRKIVTFHFVIFVLFAAFVVRKILVYVTCAFRITAFRISEFFSSRGQNSVPIGIEQQHSKLQVGTVLRPTKTLPKRSCRAGHRASPRLRPDRPYRPSRVAKRNIFGVLPEVMRLLPYNDCGEGYEASSIHFFSMLRSSGQMPVILSWWTAP